MKSGLISKSVSVGKKGYACWPGAQSVAKEQQSIEKVEKKQKEEKK